MGLQFWAATFDFTGTILIGIMALLVHRRVRQEHKIDEQVISEMKIEQSIALLGIILIIASYILNLNILF